MNHQTKINRKSYVFLLVYVFAGLSIFSCTKELKESDQNLTTQERATGVTRYPLYIPSVVSPAGLTITASSTIEDIGGGKLTNAWTYNSSFPGPTLKANTGSNVTVTFQNSLSQKSIIHWHGMLVNTLNDGQPQDAISPGGSKNYNYQIIQRAAFNWYHPHPHMLTGVQVNNGLAGGFIINDAEEAALNLPSGNYEIPLVIRDLNLDASGNISYKPTSGGSFGKIAAVNGTRDPYLNVDRAVYRFRMLNGANSRIFGLTLSNGADMILIGNDGGLLPSSSAQARMDISNGERLDVLIDFREYAAGTKIMLRDLRAGWDLLEFRVGSTTVSTGTTSTSSSFTALSGPVTTRTFNFEGMTKINGKVFDENRIDFQVPFGQVEKWILKTKGNAPHPVHIHGASFQVINRIGGRGQVYPWELGWKDTVLLEDGETVEILIRFEEYKGRYVMHCHKLEHEDGGMMTNFEVI
ncbi:MAG: multicopper oxidase family protein [Bacteroidia bacterium]